MAAGFEAVVVAGRGRDLGSGLSGDVRFELRQADLTITLVGRPIVAAYRDLTTIAVQQASVLLVLGESDARLIVDALGDRLGLLLRELRDRRARQVLADRFIELVDGDAIPLVEYRAPGEHGVAQMAYHGWGAALLPLDERRPWRLLRRAAIERVEADPAAGRVELRTSARAGADEAESVELGGLGAAAESHRQRLAGLREAALADAAAMVGQLLADAPFAARRLAADLLVDGRPVGPAELGDAWPIVERAVLAERTFAQAYGQMVELGDGPRWLSLAPRRPGQPEPLAWFFVGLPGNLVAMEIVSAGAHATYLFSVVPRLAYRGEPASALAEPARTAVGEVSEALIDMRFLRQPIYLTADQLADPRHQRSRLAIAALPSLQAARARFVGRLIHRDEDSWRAALDEAIAWHSAARDDGARWPGGAAATESDDGEPTPMEEGT